MDTSTDMRHVTRPASFDRDPEVVLAAALELLGRGEHQVLDVRRADREVTFTSRADAALSGWTFGLGVEPVDGGSAVYVAWSDSPGSTPGLAGRWRARRAARRVLRDLREVVEGREPTAAERHGAERRPSATGSAFLADLTGRRVRWAALVLLGAYLVPVLLVWGIGLAQDASLLGDGTSLAPTLGLVLGLGLVVGLTVRFGGWFQQISFGEEYMDSFRPAAGFALGWWRFLLQLGALLLVCFLAVRSGEEATAQDVSSAETRALPTYAERVPVMPGWELQSDSTRQNTYAERPNATYARSYVVPADYDLDDVEQWFADPAWATGVDGRPPFGALMDVHCDAARCLARATPPPGQPVEYVVQVRRSEVTVVEDGVAGDAGLLRVEVAYEEGERG